MKNETKKPKFQAVPQKLQARNKNSKRKLPHDTNARRRPNVVQPQFQEGLLAWVARRGREYGH